MKKYITALICFLIPINLLKIFFLRLLNHRVSYSCKIGISFIASNVIVIEKGTRIGHFNFFKVNEFILGEDTLIKNLNFVRGPLKFQLLKKSGLGNSNKIRRSKPPITYGQSTFLLGYNTQVASNHFFDLTNSVVFGSNSQVAGINTQFWTHGFYHANIGEDRVRIDGEIHIKNNVYIGSRCIFNPGVSVSDAIHIGSGSVISKSLINSGMYVNQGLRFIENDIEKVKSKLKIIKDDVLIVDVYKKTIKTLND